MAFDPHEKERIRYHLGYLNAQPAPAIVMGFPRATQPAFLVEQAMNYILPEAELRVREIVGIMDGIERKLVESLDRLAARKVGEIELNPDEGDMLRREYLHWRNQLASQLGCYPSPYSPSGGMGGGINVPVVGG